MASGKGKDLSEKGCFQSKGVKVLGKAHDGESEHVTQMIEQVFPSLSGRSDAAGSREPIRTREPVDLAKLSHYIDCSLNEATQNADGFKTDSDGRLGPGTVEFDYTGSFGTLVVEADRLGVSSQSNFSTIRSNTCVYKGKWIYELLLGSKGVMQVGWCTVKCKFTEEDGVGDTTYSFAFDGSRIQKWNMKMHSKYGEGWLAGDVISCAIDCDNGVISFMRNGCSMGDAFVDVPLGPGCAYFAAVSLSHNENLRANFGSTPLRYPLEGYRPLQDPPAPDVIKARLLFTYMDRLLPLLMTAGHTQPPPDELVARESRHRSQKATLLILSAHIMGNLAPLLKNAYVVEECLLKFLLDVSRSSQECLNSLLDLFFCLLQEQELKPCMDNLVISLLSNYRFSPVLEDFSWQRKYLVLLHALLLHVQMRKYLLKNVLFDRVKFPIFLHVKPPDDKVLACMIPCVWYKCSSKDDSDDEESKELSEEENENKRRYDASCDVLRTSIRELEEIQTNIVKLLLSRDDSTEQDSTSSRQIFQLKFREFLKENIIPPHIKIQQINHCPPLVQLCFFDRLLRALQYHLDRDQETSAEKLLGSNEIYVPSGTFCSESLDYFDCQRLGGLLSHLKKTFSETESNSNLPSKVSADETLVEILDGLIMLYNTTAHKQLGKMCSLRETFQEYIIALTDAEKKMAVCPVELVDVMTELKRAHLVFLEKVVEQARHMAWIICVIYSADKQEDVHWLMLTILRTLDQASADGQLFGFVPDFYIEACINTYNALTSYFHPIIPYTRIEGHEKSLTQYAVFLSNNFSDRRIVNTDIQDTLIQALACFVCYPRSLSALESMPEDNCMQMTKALLAPYEGRSWAQTNWILLRLWKGCGFAYRYRHLPHLKPLKYQEHEHTSASLQKPCPSKVFQQYIQRILSSDEEGATKLLDTILNQLNWAFSEFISMLQELHQFYSQSSLLLVESRRLKICATCFDISIGLLRVLEMILHLNPELFVDFERPNSELLLRRLFQLLTQVLNRVTCKSNTFEIVVNLSVPGLDTVDHFPILSSVAGILIELIVRSNGLSRERAIAALMAEPGFQLNSIEFLLGDSETGAASDEETFSLSDYKEVSAEEEQQVGQLFSILSGQVQMTPRQDIEEDMLCSICYAHTKAVKFLPCLHQSCRSCITQHLMNKNECFFCKMPVTKVVDIEEDAV